MDHLLAVSTKGAWIGWINFFLRAMAVQSKAAVARGTELLDLWTSMRSQSQGLSLSSKLLTLIGYLFQQPAVTVRGAAGVMGVSFPAAQSNIDKLIARGVLKEATGGQKNRIYVAQRIVDVIEKDDAIELD